MKYYKTKEGWYCLDFKKILPYGTFIISWYNKALDNVVNNFFEFHGISSLEDFVKYSSFRFMILDAVSTESKNKEEAYHSIKLLINNANVEFPLYFKLIEDHLELIYDTEKIEYPEFLLLDLQEIKKSDGNIKCCPVCSHLFIKSSSGKRKKYCSTECRNVAKKMIDKERSETAAGYNQKTINYLRNQLNFSEDDIMKYRDESEKMKKELDEKQYILWLEEKRNYYKSLNKK